LPAILFRIQLYLQNKTTSLTEQKVNAGIRPGTMILNHIIITPQTHMDNLLTKPEAKIKEVGE
jgi:hypothetical protein